MPVQISLAQAADPALDVLFDDLRNVSDPADIDRVVAAIWSKWSTHPTEEGLTERLGRGLIMMNQGDFVNAEMLFTDVIEADPTFAEAWNKRATLYFLIGNFDASRNDIAQTLAIEPRHFGALAGLGLIELHLENYELSLRAYEKAQQINPHLRDVNSIIDMLTERLRGLALQVIS